jgi:hypothetical protein
MIGCHCKGDVWYLYHQQEDSDTLSMQRKVSRQFGRETSTTVELKEMKAE